MSFDVSEVQKQIRTNTYLIFFLGILSLIIILGLIYLFILKLAKKLKTVENEREKLILDLQKAVDEVKTLRGFIPICASCKKIRDDKGYWESIESYISNRTEAQFSHSICPDCKVRLYPGLGKSSK